MKKWESWPKVNTLKEPQSDAATMSVKDLLEFYYNFFHLQVEVFIFTQTLINFNCWNLP